MPAETTEAPKVELQSKVPEKVAKTRSEDMLYSRSRRQALGGAITSVYLLPSGTFHVEGPNGEDWGEFKKFTGKGQALECARTGPAEEEAEEPTTEDAPEADEPTSEGDEAEAEATEEAAA